MFIWYVSHLPALTIDTVTTDGGETVSADDVRMFAGGALAGSYLDLVPRRFAYLYPHDAIVDAIMKHPRVKGVTVDRTSRKSLSITIDEYTPTALWCPTEVSKSPCFYIDDDGFAFDEAPGLVGGSFTRFVTEPVSEVIRGAMLGGPPLSVLHEFVRRTNDELGFRVATIIERENGDVEFVMSGGGTFLASSERDFTETFENLKAVLTSSEFSRVGPGDFQYVDVRFGNKVYVNETQPELGIASTTEILSE